MTDFIDKNLSKTTFAQRVRKAEKQLKNRFKKYGVE
jgi:hypothetical protein